MQEKSHLILGQSQRVAYRLLSLAGRTLYISGCKKTVTTLQTIWVNFGQGTQHVEIISAKMQSPSV